MAIGDDSGFVMEEEEVVRADGRCDNTGRMRHYMRMERGRGMSKSARAGVAFPVSRVARHLKLGRYASRISLAAPVFLAAVLQYLAAEVLDLAGNVANDNRKCKIIPRHIQLAVRNDLDLGKLLAGVTIAYGGVVSTIHPKLIKDHGEQKRSNSANIFIKRSTNANEDSSILSLSEN